MKKRGFTPDARTYATVLNAYASSHLHIGSPPTARTLSRATLVYEQSRRYMLERQKEIDKAKADTLDIGLALPSGHGKASSQAGTSASAPGSETTDKVVDSEISIYPTNAYLNYISRCGMYEELQRVLEILPSEGPLCPDSSTYTTIYQGYFTARRTNASQASNSRDRRDDGDAMSDQAKDLDGEPRRLWRRAVQDLDGQNGRDTIDSGLAILALKALFTDTLPSQQLASDLIPLLWSLPPVGQAFLSEQQRTDLLRKHQLPETLPRLGIDVKAATMILFYCPSKTEKAHYARQFVYHPDIDQSSLDVLFLAGAVQALANVGAVKEIIEIFDSYQPTTAKGERQRSWPKQVWQDALTASRWSTAEGAKSNQWADFESAVMILRRMTHMPLEVEHGAVGKPYQWSTPNKDETDIRGVPWIPTVAQEPEAKALSILIKCSRGRGWKEARMAYCIFEYFHKLDRNLFLLTILDRDSRLRGDSRQGAVWALELAKDVVLLLERLSEKNGLAVDERAKMAAMQGIIKRLQAIVPEYKPPPGTRRRLDKHK